jgi:carbon monoxide dehydrogenase subunit G
LKIDNSFDVPVPLVEAWTILMDIQRIAPCVPGAELLEQVDERTYKGKVSVRLGPIALSFLGTVFFEHLDDTLKQARVRASGADSKGRGGAAATVDFALLPVADGTSVRIKTKLDLTGSIAQYGRASGVLQSVANQLVGEFAQNLRRSLDLDKKNVRQANEAEGRSPTQNTAAAAPILGLRLIWRAFIDTIKQWFGSEPPKQN